MERNVSEEKPPLRFVPMVVGALSMMLMAIGCGGGGGGGGGVSGTASTVTTNLSDPANQCTDQYSHVWVTVSDVQASINSSGNGGFVDLTPGLSSRPVQVDLLGAANTDCFLAQLGVKSGLPAGDYQQIRVILLANNTSGVTLASGTNNCGGPSGPWNCVQPVGSMTTDTLSLPSEAQTGIKIPPGQIAKGGLMVTSGSGMDIDIDFNACTSVVEAGHSGKFLLKPTLRASEVGTSPLIAGTVVLGSVSGTSVSVVSPTAVVPGANVWLEQEPGAANFTVGSPTPSASPTPTVSVEGLVQTTTTDNNGNFNFCPVGPGTYDVVVDSASAPSSSLPTNATVAVGAVVTSNGGPNNLMIPVVPEPTPSASPTPSWGQISAIVATENTTASGDNVTLNGLQPFTPPGGSGTIQALIPLIYDTNATDGTMPMSVPPTVTTSSTFSNTNCPALSASTSCPTGTNCACFNLGVPVSNPVVGAANSTGSGFTASSSSTVGYAISGTATTMNGSSTDYVCSSPMLVTDPSSLFTVTPGMVEQPSNPVLQFPSCD